MLFIVVAAYFILALFIRSKKKNAGNIMLILGIVVLDLVVSFLSALFILLGALGAFVNTGVAVLLAFIAVQLVAAALILLVTGKFRSRIAITVMAVLSCIWCLCTGVVAARAMITNNIPTVTEGSEPDLWRDYGPYSENSRLATLDEAPTLHLEGAYPSMDGATALFPVYASFAQALYEKEKLRPDTLVDRELLDCNTTAYAYERIVDGSVDIIFVAGASEEQAAYAKENGVELVFTPIGKEAFVFIVNEKNPLDNITIAQVRGIYSGKITDWKELGVRGLGAIRAFQRESGSGSQTALEQVMGDTEIMQPTEINEVRNAMGGMYESVADYRNHRNAIGYTFRFYATRMYDGSGVKLLSLEGIAPSEENIRNGTYPVTGEFYAVTRSDADENTKALVEWICGEQGQELIEKTGYTPLD